MHLFPQLQRLLPAGEPAPRTAWGVLWLMVASYAGLFSLAAIYKYHSFWMGFDLGVHEQLIWNTMHGRIAAVSMFGNTTSYLGIDIIIVELLYTPLYALLPRTETLLVLQVGVAATGAVPLFLLARERAQHAWSGWLAALLYLAALPVQYAILYEFQIRTAGTVFFLWAFYCFERQRLGWFALFGLLALWTRSDASFALAAIGLYAGVQRRGWRWVVLPIGMGAGWLLLCVGLLIPLFRSDDGFQYAFIYRWLGDTPLEMLHTLLLRPGYVAAHMFRPEKLRYLLELLAPLLFLPLLRPGLLLIALPSLLLNLLSADRIHWSIRYHYQAFVLPFLLIATLYVVIDLYRTRQRAGVVLALALLLLTLGAQVWLRTPLLHLATRERDDERIAFVHTVMEQVPPDAALAVTSTLGPHLAQRQQLYFYPGGDLIYATRLIDEAEYLLIDRHEVPPAAWDTLQQQGQQPGWRVLVNQRDYLLLRRVE